MGIVRLLDMLGEAREALRNEALLLLVGLARASPDVQRIAAFEGAFDRLLGIVKCACCFKEKEKFTSCCWGHCKIPAL